MTPKQPRGLLDGPFPHIAFLQVSSSTRLDLRSVPPQLSVFATNSIQTFLKALENLFPSCQKPNSMQMCFVIFSTVSQTLVCSISLLTAFSHIPFFPSCSLCVCVRWLSRSASSLKKLCRYQTKQTVIFSEVHHLYKGTKQDKLLMKWLLSVTPCKLPLFVLSFQRHTVSSQYQKQSNDPSGDEKSFDQSLKINQKSVYFFNNTQTCMLFIVTNIYQ